MESLRLTRGVTMRQTRIAPTEALVYEGHVIPPGTPAGQSAYLLHMDPTVFPDPQKFRPERWIESAEKGQQIQRNMLPFSRGTRQCLGMSLAYSEMYTMTAKVARTFDLELHETTDENVRITRDDGVGWPEKGAYKVSVKVTGVAEN